MMKKILTLTICALMAVCATAQRRPVSLGIATNHITFACICGEEWQSNWIPSKLSVNIPLSNKFELTPSGSFNTASYNYRKAKSFWNAALDAKYNITNTRLQPFVMAGGSFSNIDDGKGSQGYAGFTGGAGLNFWITEGVAVTLQENYHHMPDYKNTHYFQLAGGVTFRLGKVGDAVEKPKKEPEEDKSAYLDSDKDGVMDANDLCPREPGSLAAKGCPDQDADGVTDTVDKCPNDAGPRDTNGCPDDDADGVADADDKCPTVAGSKELFGCADQDGDGIGDGDDACPTLAGSPAMKGCPDKDGDGISDKDDACPDQGGSASGCPDKDGDGVADKDDACPDANGGSGNGCPQITAAEKKEIQSQFTKIPTKVLFETGKNTIRPSFLPILDNIWAVMVAHPGAVFKVDGHADIIGEPDNNRELSQRRADVVKEYVLSKGQINPNRIIATGYGSDRPVADNKTEAGRERNRRVEFTLSEK